jgi:hypothetical protein
MYLKGSFEHADRLIHINERNATVYRALMYLAATSTKAKYLTDTADTNWAKILTELSKGDREDKLLADVLAGRKPYTELSPQRLMIDPWKKRVWLVLLANRFPDHAEELLTLAKKLNYHHDAISLCLNEFLEKK